jgi:hypothetical protein
MGSLSTIYFEFTPFLPRKISSKYVEKNNRNKPVTPNFCVKSIPKLPRKFSGIFGVKFHGIRNSK